MIVKFWNVANHHYPIIIYTHDGTKNQRLNHWGSLCLLYEDTWAHAFPASDSCRKREPPHSAHLTSSSEKPSCGQIQNPPCKIWTQICVCSRKRTIYSNCHLFLSVQKKRYNQNVKILSI